MILLYNGRIWGHSKETDSVVIKKDKIFYIGEFNKIPDGEYEKKINLQNKLLLPSFIDTHTHFSEYVKLKLQIDFSEAGTIKQILELIKKYPQKSKGYGLKISLFNKTELHEIFKNTKRDISLTVASSDYHSYLTIGTGLTDWPPEQKIVISQNYKKELYKNLKIALQELYKCGITSIHEMAFKKQDFYFYDDIGKNIEVCRHFPLEMLDEMIKKKQKSYTDSDYLRLGSLKLFYDGSIGSGSALMFDSDNGKVNLKLSEIEKIIKKALLNEFSVSVHAIGDKAVDDIVNIFIKHKTLIKNFVRIEHAQTIRDKTIKKLENIKDKVYLSMQPLHIRDDYHVLKDVETGKFSFRFKSMENLIIGFSSDVPVVEFNPFLSIHYAITHKLNKKEAITIKEAIDNYTINATKLSGEENIKGSITKGKLANLMLIDDFSKYDENFWLNAESYLTILRGRVVYSNL